MAQYYREKAPTGKEYVEATKKFHAYTVFTLLKLPKKWKAYILDPIAEASAKIESLVVMANRVYISEPNQTKEELLAAIAERDKYLIEAMRWFSVFDDRREMLLGQVDYMKAESKRLTQILMRLIEAREKKIEKAHSEEINPDKTRKEPEGIEASAEVKNVSEEIETSAKGKNVSESMTIEVRHKLDEIEYRTADDKQVVKLGITNHHMERWAYLEDTAIREIKKRYAADNGKAKKLKEELRDAVL